MRPSFETAWNYPALSADQLLRGHQRQGVSPVQRVHGFAEGFFNGSGGKPFGFRIGGRSLSAGYFVCHAKWKNRGRSCPLWHYRRNQFHMNSEKSHRTHHILHEYSFFFSFCMAESCAEKAFEQWMRSKKISIVPFEVIVRNIAAGITDADSGGLTFSMDEDGWGGS